MTPLPDGLIFDLARQAGVEVPDAGEKRPIRCSSHEVGHASAFLSLRNVFFCAADMAGRLRLRPADLQRDFAEGDLPALLVRKGKMDPKPSSCVGRRQWHARHLVRAAELLGILSDDRHRSIDAEEGR